MILGIPSLYETVNPISSAAGSIDGSRVVTLKARLAVCSLLALGSLEFQLHTMPSSGSAITGDPDRPFRFRT